MKTSWFQNLPALCPQARPCTSLSLCFFICKNPSNYTTQKYHQLGPRPLPQSKYGHTASQADPAASQRLQKLCLHYTAVR